MLLRVWSRNTKEMVSTHGICWCESVPVHVVFAAVGSLWGFLAETIILIRLPANWTIVYCLLSQNFKAEQEFIM